jgi:hypothetical protein
MGIQDQPGVRLPDIVKLTWKTVLGCFTIVYAEDGRITDLISPNSRIDLVTKARSGDVATPMYMNNEGLNVNTW